METPWHMGTKWQRSWADKLLRRDSGDFGTRGMDVQQRSYGQL